MPSWMGPPNPWETLEWTPLVVARSDEKSLSSIGYPVNPYRRNQNISWLITSDAPCFAVIKITVKAVALADQDHLNFYDGTSAENRNLKSFSGNGSQSTFFSTGPKMLVVFNSSDNEKSPSEGFSFKYQMKSPNPIFLRKKTQRIKDSTANITVYFTSAFPPTSVVWRKDGNVVFEDTNYKPEQTADSYDPGQLYESTMTLSSLSDSSFSCYKVSVANRVGFAERIAELKRPLSVPILKDFAYTVSEDSLVLEVPFDVFDKSFSVAWLRNETELDDDNKYKKVVKKLSEPNHYISELRISSLTADDFTVYQMTVSNEMGKASVNVPVRFTKRYLPDIQNYDITVEKDAVIRLTYQSIPDVVSVTWFKEGIPLQADNKYFMTTLSLKIIDVTDEDFGMYGVSVTNAAGTVSRNFELRTPKVLPTYTACNQSTGVVVTCKVDTCNKFRFLPWKHIIDNTEVRQLKGISNGNVNTLTIPTCFVEDRGHYLCVTEEESDKGAVGITFQDAIFVDPKVPPLIGQDIRYNEIQSGINITVDVYSSSPISYLKCFAISNYDLSEVRDVSYEEREVILPIRNLNVTLPGLRISIIRRFNIYTKYSLEVGNDIGISSFVWTIKDPRGDVPFIYDRIYLMNSDGELDIGQKFRSDTFPDSVEWRNAITGDILNDTSKYWSQLSYVESKYGANLFIKNVTDDDYTVYKLTVRNRKGFTESFLKITNPNEGIPVYRNSSRDISGKTVTIAVNFTSNPAYPDVTWYLSGMILENSNPKYNITIVEIQMVLDDGDVVAGYKTVLTDRNVEGNNSQIYRVRLSNQLGYNDVYLSPNQGCIGATGYE